jgi:hypothetical protein
MKLLDKVKDQSEGSESIIDQKESRRSVMRKVLAGSAAFATSFFVSSVVSTN